MAVTYNTPSEILALINKNDSFHDCEVNWIEYDGKSKACIHFLDCEKSYHLLFDDVVSFSIYSDPSVMYINEIQFSNDNGELCIDISGADIIVKSKMLTIEEYGD